MLGSKSKLLKGRGRSRVQWIGWLGTTYVVHLQRVEEESRPKSSSHAEKGKRKTEENSNQQYHSKY